MPRLAFGSEVSRLLNDAQLGKYKYHPSPEDWRDVWIYFAITDRFNNPKAPPNGEWHMPYNGMQGGNFLGIIEKLDYLKELGVGALWVSPIQKQPAWNGYAYHGYGIQDYLTVEPRYTSDPERAKADPQFAIDEFRHLVDEAHARGIYVILDIVLNHVGDVFGYENGSSDAPWRDSGPYKIFWRDETGQPRQDWENPPNDPEISQDALVWPRELQRNDFFRRMGNSFDRPTELHELAGDFYSLKEMVTDYTQKVPGLGFYKPVQEVLIQCYCYMISMFDLDGFRIDTLKYIEPEFARLFGARIREYAMTIGKKNFFTYGEVFDGEEKIARFIGRQAQSGDELVGVDAALDFPLYFKLIPVIKGQSAPLDVILMYENRKRVTQQVISSQGDASRYFVTFLDNHDVHSRIHYSDPENQFKYLDQTTMALTAIFTLQGIPCVYYGTEQGLSGRGDGMEWVREALWGKPNAFDQEYPIYRIIARLAELRKTYPALRYGRQYFRQIAGDGWHFGYSDQANGILAYSRLLADMECVVVMNTNLGYPWAGEVIVDYAIRPGRSRFEIVFSNKRDITGMEKAPFWQKNEGEVTLPALDGVIGTGPARSIRVELQPGEAQIWVKGLIEEEAG